MISLISGIILKEEPSCKLMLKYNLKNYLPIYRYFMEVLCLSFQ